MTRRHTSSGSRGGGVLLAGRATNAYLVPSVEEHDHFFLKTIIQSRKATRKFLKPEQTDDEG
jgi:hypothetical protein